jgi:hypothetical protein
MVVVSPKEHIEKCFMDLAAAIGSMMVQTKCGNGDIKDTYSYILSVLARVNFFVTEDKDIKRLYQYFSIVKNKSFRERTLEIQQIKEFYQELNANKEFPLEKVLNFLFSENDKNLTVPISILQLKNALPQVLDKFDNVIWIYRSIAEIQFLRTLVNKLPNDWDYTIIDKAKKRIGQIAKSVGVESGDKIDESSLKTKLIERENNWSQEAEDEDLGFSLDSQFNILHKIIYQEEIADTHEYDSLEEYFTLEETKTFNVKCQKCDHEFEIVINYNGVTDIYEREMGPENSHEWSGEEECPNCGSEVSLIYELYEYPIGTENDEDTECDGCTIVPEKPPEKPPSTTLEDFMRDLRKK